MKVISLLFDTSAQNINKIIQINTILIKIKLTSIYYLFTPFKCPSCSNLSA
jgi:hypothetical protein